jgi:hypothetical protein
MANSTQFGCSFTLQNEPTVGSEMEIEISLPEEIAGSPSARVYCRGKVVKVQKREKKGRTEVLCSVENYRFIPEESSADQPVTKDRS